MRNELVNSLWQALTDLRGSSLELSEQVNYILRLLVLKLLSDLADDARHSVGHPYAIPSSARWAWLQNQTKGVGARLNDACVELEEANPSLKRVLTGFDFERILPGTPQKRDQLILRLMERLSEMPHFSGELVTSGDLGEACETLFFRLADALGRGSGEFYTPPSINQLVVDLLDVEARMRVCDPVCGMGSSLTACVRKVARLSVSESVLSGALVLHGQEKNIVRWAQCCMNLMLHGIFDARIEPGDVLRNPLLVDDDQLLRYDRILADPPYGVEDWGSETAGADPFNRFKPVPSKNASDYAFIQHCMATLADGGRAVFLTLRSTLFRSGDEERQIRRDLLEKGCFEAVIALPGNLYATTNIAPVVLVLRQGKVQSHRSRVLFIDASQQGVTERRQRVLRPQDVHAIARAFHGMEETVGFARAVPVEEIAANDWNLNVALYVRHEEQYERKALDEQLEEIATIEGQRDDAARRMDKLIEGLRRSSLLEH